MVYDRNAVKNYSIVISINGNEIVTDMPLQAYELDILINVFSNLSSDEANSDVEKDIRIVELSEGDAQEIWSSIITFEQ